MALERPPRWGLVAIVVLVLANVGLVVLLAQRSSSAGPPTPAASAAGSAAAATSTSSGSTDAPATTSGSAAPVSSASGSDEPGLLAVYGDGYSSGNSEGGVGAAGWPALVADELGMRLQLGAATLTGYVRPGSTDQTYPQLVQAQPPTGAAVTVVFGSRNDVDAAPAAVQAAAEETFREILTADPATALVVIGPCWSSADAPQALTAVSGAVRSAAEAVGATYVDPLQLGWFADPTGLVSPVDDISILDPGHQYLAGLIAPLVEAARAT